MRPLLINLFFFYNTVIKEREYLKRRLKDFEYRRCHGSLGTRANVELWVGKLVLFSFLSFSATLAI